MEKEDKLIMEEAPIDTSTYEEGEVGIKEYLPEEEPISFSFYDFYNFLREEQINE
jgi:hypothetical protein